MRLSVGKSAWSTFTVWQIHPDKFSENIGLQPHGPCPLFKFVFAWIFAFWKSYQTVSHLVHSSAPPPPFGAFQSLSSDCLPSGWYEWFIRGLNRQQAKDTVHAAPITKEKHFQAKVVINAPRVRKLIASTRFEPIWWPVLSRSAYPFGSLRVWIIHRSI